MPKKYTAKDYIKRTAKKAVKKKAKKAARGNPAIAFLLFLVIVAAYLGVCVIDYNNIDVGFEVDLGRANVLQLIWPKSDIEPLPVPAEGEAMYHFIDVGQGDAILITTSEGNILVDTSEKGAQDQLDGYLKAAGVESIKYLVLTHPDADHIGNAQYIVENYTVEKVVMSEYANASTQTFINLIDSIELRQIEVLLLGVGDSFELGGVQNYVLAPAEDYDDNNENSLVIRSSFGETVVMLTGDAEKESEADIVGGGRWNKATLRSDILKVGHHGSNSSTTEEFLDAVSPKYAIISCGSDNKYGHPHYETMDLLAEKGIEVYRTDLQGSIIFKTDGKTLNLVETTKAEDKQ